MPPLDGCHAKLDRAKRHIADIDVDIRLLLNEQAQVLVEKFDPRERKSFYELPSAPLRLSVVIGEAAYNLRSALDHLAWQLALLNEEAAEASEGDVWPSPKTQFPIFKDAEKFERGGGRSGRSQIAALLPLHQKLIVELQPCYRGDPPDREPLWLLQRISNIDKHRTLNTVILDVQNPPSEFVLPRHSGTGIKVLTGGSVVDIAQARANGTEAHLEGDFTFDVAFGDISEPFGGEPVAPLLNAIRSEVEGIINSFASEF